MRKRFRWTAVTALVLGSGLSGNPQLSYAVPPGGLPDAAPPFGLPASAPPFGKGVGKGIGKGVGKGVAVAKVTYLCLGLAKHFSKVSSPYSYVTELYRAEAGNGQYATLEGGATGDLVTEGDIATVPTHMAEASIRTDGLTLQPFDSCGTLAHSELYSVVEGVNTTDPDATGTAYVRLVISFNGLRLETQKAKGSNGIMTAATRTTLKTLGFQESFNVSASGELLDVPPGMSVTNLSEKGGDHYMYDISGKVVVSGVTLNFGPGIKNNLSTEFAALGKISSKNISGPTIAAGFASAQAVNTIAIEVQSLDPSVSFRFVPAQ
jgi:hypothetical protein